MFRITLMLEYDTRRIDMVPFNCLHEPTLKNSKIHSLCHLLLHLAHVIHATGSPRKNCITSVFNCLTHMMSL